MKDIVLFVNAIRPATFLAFRQHQKQTGRRLIPVVMVDETIQSSIETRNAQHHHRDAVIKIQADFNSPASILAALKPYQDRIFAVTSQYENSIHELQKLVPYLPYLPTPTEESLEWATEKKLMRAMLEAYDPALVPAYQEVFDHSDRTIRAIERRMTYPVIVKPSGLEGSLLVSRANNAAELKAAIAHTTGEMKQAYNKWIKRQRPAILVEEFMEGKMYSIDTYISPLGLCRHTPPVRVVTGHNIGFDDFFGYIRFTPSDLTAADIRAAKLAAEESCKALGLRAVTAHVELMKTPGGWKIIELGPRIGGYRHDIYSLSYGINHIVNDVLNRGGEDPIIPRRSVAHTAMLNIYAREEGILASVGKASEIKALPSFVSMNQLCKIGDRVAFAKNNGDPVFEILLSHSDRRQFKADIHAAEDLLDLRVRHHQLAETR